jgi:hypothetical protein
VEGGAEHGGRSRIIAIFFIIIPDVHDDDLVLQRQRPCHRCCHHAGSRQVEEAGAGHRHLSGLRQAELREVVGCRGAFRSGWLAEERWETSNDPMDG